jgi:hypothetical protein
MRPRNFLNVIQHDVIVEEKYDFGDLADAVLRATFGVVSNCVPRPAFHYPASLLCRMLVGCKLRLLLRFSDFLSDLRLLLWILVFVIGTLQNKCYNLLGSDKWFYR